MQVKAVESQKILNNQNWNSADSFNAVNTSKSIGYIRTKTRSFYNINFCQLKITFFWSAKTKKG